MPFRTCERTEGRAMMPGEALRLSRRRAGLSQREIAEALGVTPAMVSYVEHDERKFPQDRLSLLPDEVREAVVAALLAEAKASYSGSVRKILADGTGITDAAIDYAVKEIENISGLAAKSYAPNAV